MTDSDATQGDNMSPAEFAKLMGAYPQPAENPLPTYGGYMDNSAANFSWVQNNDYFGAETKMEDGVYKTTCDCGTVLTWDEGRFNTIEKDGNRVISEPLEVERLEFPSPQFDHFEEELSIKCPTCGEYHTCEIEAPVYHDRLEVNFDAENLQSNVYFDPNGVSDEQWEEQIVNYGVDVTIEEFSHVMTPELRKRINDLGNGLLEAETFEAETDDYEHDCMNCGEGIENENDALKMGYEMLCYPCQHEYTDEELDEALTSYNAESFSERMTRLWPGYEGDIFTDPDTYMMYYGAKDKDGKSHLADFYDIGHWTSGLQGAPSTSYRKTGEKSIFPKETICGMKASKENPLQHFGSKTRWNPKKAVKALEKESIVCPKCLSHAEKQLWKFDIENFEATTGYGYDDPPERMTDEEGWLELHERYEDDEEWGQMTLEEFKKAFIEQTEKDDEIQRKYEQRLKDEGRDMDGNPIKGAETFNGLSAEEYYAEMEELTDGVASITNRFGDGVGIIQVDDEDLEDVSVEITDGGGDVVYEGILGDEDVPEMEEDDYYFSENKKKSSILPMALGVVGAIFAYQPVMDFLSSKSKKEQKMAETPELVENPNTGNLDPAQYEEMVVESTGYAVDVIPQVLDGSFMGSRFAALPTERYVEYNEPGIGAHTDIAMNRDEMYLEPEMAMVQASESIKESQAPGQSPYNSTTGEENPDFDVRVLKETTVVSLDPAVKPFIPQSMSGYTGNANTPPSVYDKMFNIGVLGQTPAFVPGSGDIGSSHTGSRSAIPNSLGIAGAVGGPLSDQVNANYTDGQTSMSLAQWAIENTVSQTSDTEAVVIDRSSGAMKRVRRV